MRALPTGLLDRETRPLPEEIRRHLGRLLASAYQQESFETEAVDHFADLLSKLDTALDEAGRQADASFQAGLLAVTPNLRRFAMSLTRDPTAADDIVQDTMLRAWRSRDSFTLGTNLEAWAFTIMRNQFYSHHRKLFRETQDEDGAQAAKLAILPEQGSRLDLQDVRAALGRLAPVMREALVLVTIENLSYEEAATVMNCQIGTIKSRVWRAREQLARVLGYTGAEIGADGATLSAMGVRIP